MHRLNFQFKKFWVLFMLFPRLFWDFPQSWASKKVNVVHLVLLQPFICLDSMRFSAMLIFCLWRRLCLKPALLSDLLGFCFTLNYEKSFARGLYWRPLDQGASKLTTKYLSSFYSQYMYRSCSPTCPSWDMGYMSLSASYTPLPPRFRRIRILEVHHR